MRRHILKNTTGFCPVIAAKTDVKIDYSEIPILGSASKHYKAVSVDCDYSEQCTERYCPIMGENPTFEI